MVDKNKELLDKYREIDISDLLQLVLALQAELGVASELVLDVLKSGDLNYEELERSLRAIGDMSYEALDYISGESEEDGDDGNGDPIDNVH
jgi:hypothetical protein